MPGETPDQGCDSAERVRPKSDALGHRHGGAVAGGWRFVWVCLTLCAGVALLGASTGRAADQEKHGETIRVDLRLRTGGGISGPVLDSTDHGLVVVHDNVPYVFAWEELEGGSAFGTRRELLRFARGGKDRLTAEDHFQLGLFARRHGRNDLAADSFHRATRLDAGYRARIKEVSSERELYGDGDGPLEFAIEGDVASIVKSSEDPSDEPRSDPELNGSLPPAIASVPLDGRREEVRAAYEKFGAEVREVIGEDVTLIETDHFLIWTDWRRHRDRLGDWCEAMYAAVCNQFGLSPSDDVFLAKCPVYCWRSKARFQRFARHFDGYDGSGAIGYTRSIAENGHVHVVLLRQGRSEADFDRFAATLVHEGTHAFMHRLYSSTLIPHWVNEGYADLVAERVLGDRCVAGENATLLARQIVRHDWPLGDLLRHAGPIETHQYPVAHSVVSFLEGRGRERFAGFIRSLKEGQSVETALTAHFDMTTVDELETQWRRAIRDTDPQLRQERAVSQETSVSGDR